MTKSFNGIIKPKRCFNSLCKNIYFNPSPGHSNLNLAFLAGSNLKLGQLSRKLRATAAGRSFCPSWWHPRGLRGRFGGWWTGRRCRRSKRRRLRCRKSRANCLAQPRRRTSSCPWFLTCLGTKIRTLMTSSLWRRRVAARWLACWVRLDQPLPIRTPFLTNPAGPSWFFRCLAGRSAWGTGSRGTWPVLAFWSAQSRNRNLLWRQNKDVSRSEQLDAATRWSRPEKLARFVKRIFLSFWLPLF